MCIILCEFGSGDACTTKLSIDYTEALGFCLYMKLRELVSDYTRIRALGFLVYMF